MKVMQIVSGDLWAGKENLCVVLVRELAREAGLDQAAIVFNSGRTASELGDAGATVHVADESRYGILGMLRRVNEILAAETPEILHVHGYKEHILAAFARKPGRPGLIRTYHGLAENPVSWHSMKAISRAVLQAWVLRHRTDAAVVVSHEMEQRFQDGTGRARLLQIHNGIETGHLPAASDKAAWKESMGLGADTPVVGIVGRLTAVKRVDRFLEMASRLREDCPDAVFAIVGDGPERPALERKAASLGLARHALFLGHREDAVRVIAALDILVMTSDHEGIPMVLLEALGLGVPVVAFEVGGIGEVVREGMEGFLAPPGEVGALIKACKRIFKEPELADRISRNGRERLEECFAAERMARQYAGLYADLVKSRDT